MNGTINIAIAVRGMLCNINTNVLNTSSRSLVNLPISRLTSSFRRQQICQISRKSPLALTLTHTRNKSKSASTGISRSRSKFIGEKGVANINQTQLDSFRDMSKAETVVETDGWMQIGAYNIFAWTISGLESCIVIKSDNVTVAFDMGIAIKESIHARHVFITHGHTDHIGAVASHVAKRALFGQKPAQYYVPPHLVEPLQADLQAHCQMAETIEDLGKAQILPIVEGDTVYIKNNYFVKTFPTIHRIPSQGYILYKEEKKLKDEYKGMDGFDVAALHRQGVVIHDIITTPEVAYTGDTIIDVFINPPTPDLLKVKVLITEATFLDREEASGQCVIKKARSRGHTHLQEIVQNAHLFNDVGHLVLVHFSNKFTSKYISDCIRDQIPRTLKHKVIPATVATATRPTTYSV